MISSRNIIWGAIGAVVLFSIVAGVGGVGMALYASRDKNTQASGDASGAKSELARFAVGPLARLETPAELKMATDYGFKDRNGADVHFSDFKGKVTVVNLWAMWCAPCRTEMPTFVALAKHYADNPDVVVLPINVDSTQDALANAKSFIDVHEPLPLYSDMSFQLPFEFPGKGAMPRTVFLDREGRVRAVFSGEADWNSPEAHALINALLAEGGQSAPSA